MKGWATPPIVALYVGRPVKTIRTWAYRGDIPIACDTNTGRLVVHAATVRAFAATRATRATTTKQPA